MKRILIALVVATVVAVASTQAMAGGHHHGHHHGGGGVRVAITAGYPVGYGYAYRPVYRAPVVVAPAYPVYGYPAVVPTYPVYGPGYYSPGYSLSIGW